MKKQWENHNINLQQLAQTIQNFYTKKGLKTATKTSKKGWKIQTIVKEYGTATALTTLITGTPNNFTIETIPSEYEDTALKIGLSTTIFGGGNILLPSIKIHEKLEKIEKEFWDSIEETIAQLTTTARNPY
jgi:hypothetical protein